MRKKRIIGLTGNIGCGKSTVAKMLAELGVPVFDADQISRDVVALGEPALTRIAQEFGNGVLNSDGTLDRAKLREVVFGDSRKKNLLENILHPAILERSEKLMNEEFKKGTLTVVYEATLLFEAGRDKGFDGVLLVTCEPEAQKKRILARDPALEENLADSIIAQQMPQAEKRRLANWVIENNGSLADLKAKVVAWHDKVIATK